MKLVMTATLLHLLLLPLPSTLLIYSQPKSAISQSIRRGFFAYTACHSSYRKWVCECSKGDDILGSLKKDEVVKNSLFGTEDDRPMQIPTQAQSLVEGSRSMMVSEFKPPTDVDYLQVLFIL
ncbi:unnamed protein product [Rhodiola kirilowii]